MLDGVVLWLVVYDVALLQQGSNFAEEGRPMLWVVQPELHRIRNVANALAVAIRAEGGCAAP